VSIPSQIIDEIRERCSLAELIGESVTLKPAGRFLKGLCPFHQEKTPSFSVNEEEGTYHCFGCGKHGSAFDYVMETKGFTFVEAVKFLSGRLGITIPLGPGEDYEELQGKRQLANALRTLSQIIGQEVSKLLFSDELGKPARQYLQTRGIEAQTATTFSLGYVPQRWEIMQDRILVASKSNSLLADYPEEKIIEFLNILGFLKPRSGGKTTAQLYSPFFDRLLFPITRSDGQAIAFGGRIFGAESDRPKYLNSPESPIYLKRKTFYGMAQGLNSIRRERLAYVVEGYLDVISLHQAGVTNCLATCGTAVTSDHAKVLSRLVNEVVVVFDGDGAGQRAAAKCFEVFLNSGIEVKAVLLPDGQDPDSLAQKSPGEVKGIFESKRVPLVDVYLDTLLTGEAGESSAAAMGKASSLFAKLLLKVVNPVEREFLTRRAAQKFNVSVESFGAVLEQERGKAKSVPTPQMVPNREDFVAKQKSAKPTFSDNRKPHKEFASTLDEKGMLRAYYRQLLVAVIVEPTLAPTVLAMPSLVEGGDVAPSLPQNIRSFIDHISQSDFIGLGSSELEDTSEQQRQRVAAEVSKLVIEYQLEEFDLLTEAFRQCDFGGAKPSAVVADAVRSTSRVSLRGQVQRLRIEENQVQDVMSREQLVQQKLLRKRTLEKL